MDPLGSTSYDLLRSAQRPRAREFSHKMIVGTCGLWPVAMQCSELTHFSRLQGGRLFIMTYHDALSMSMAGQHIFVMRALHFKSSCTQAYKFVTLGLLMKGMCSVSHCPDYVPMLLSKPQAQHQGLRNRCYPKPVEPVRAADPVRGG